MPFPAKVSIFKMIPDDPKKITSVFYCAGRQTASMSLDGRSVGCKEEFVFKLKNCYEDGFRFRCSNKNFLKGILQ